ncbi:DUF7525 family protein [Halegenticoccus tardaugens]|uniref:DUF7525 family protein n=1 Tax=Halegenticoccus tardaugens TaxID=2071624 RepID=UPI00100A50CB|nr:hypothetical protein [Halegenticoccus tardaugens]
MTTQATRTDMGIGFAVLFSLLAVGGALVMLAAGDQLTTAWGFAAAMIAAAVAVVGTQAYWD